MIPIGSAAVRTKGNTWMGSQPLESWLKGQGLGGFWRTIHRHLAGGGTAMCSTLHFLDTSAISSERQATMVGQAAVHKLSMIYNLFPAFFHRRVKREKCNKSVSPKYCHSQKDHNHEEE